MDEGLETLLVKHRAFQMIEDVTTPLMSIGRYAPLSTDRRVSLSDGRTLRESEYVNPRLLDPHLFFTHIDENLRLISGDFIRSVAPPDFCWNEAVLGCPVRMRSGSAWAEPFLKSWDQLDAIKLDRSNEWLEKLLDFSRFLVAEFHVKRGIPVSQPLSRGPLDMAVAAMGPVGFCASIYTSPEQLRRFMEICTEVFVKAAEMRLDVTPRFHDGSVHYGIWWPGEFVMTQADNSALVSPQVFRENLLAHYQRLMRSFESTLFHFHSLGSLHVAESMLDEKGLKCVQVSLDFPGRRAQGKGPDINVLSLIPTLTKIKEKKPLILTGPVTEEELERIRKGLSPNGLCLQLSLL